jgi:methyl-accepting chemotaxis protein
MATLHPAAAPGSVIAAAVEQQTATTSEMSRTVVEAATGIARSIDHVAEAARSSSQGVGEAQRATAELAVLSSELRQTVERVRV